MSLNKINTIEAAVSRLDDRFIFDRSDSINKTRTSDLKVTSNRTDYELYRVMVEAASKYFSSALKVTFIGDVYALYRMMVEASSMYFSSALSNFKESKHNY